MTDFGQADEYERFMRRHDELDRARKERREERMRRLERRVSDGLGDVWGDITLDEVACYDSLISSVDPGHQVAAILAAERWWPESALITTGLSEFIALRRETSIRKQAVFAMARRRNSPNPAGMIRALCIRVLDDSEYDEVRKAAYAAIRTLCIEDLTLEEIRDRHIHRDSIDFEFVRNKLAELG